MILAIPLVVRIWLIGVILLVLSACAAQSADTEITTFYHEGVKCFVTDMGGIDCDWSGATGP